MPQEVIDHHHDQGETEIISSDRRIKERILIIQENGRHSANSAFRECFALQRAFFCLGIQADVWGKGHDNFDHKFDDFIAGYNLLISLENYDDGWHPDLSVLKIPKAFWCIDAHMGVERYLSFVAKNNFDMVFNATEAYVEKFSGITGKSLWLPNAYDSFLIDKFFNAKKTVPLGFCGNIVNRGKWIEYLKHKWNLHHDNMVIGLDMVRAVNSYHIHWNLNASIDINYRTFETLGCRTCLITNRTPGIEKLFTPGQHLIIYENRYDMDEKISYYLDHPKQCEMIATQGYNHVRSHHKYIHRAEQILNEMGIDIHEAVRHQHRITNLKNVRQIISEKQFLFISGATKSGTTLLANILDSSEEIAFLKNSAGKLEEGQWVQNVYDWGNGNKDINEHYHMHESHPLANVENGIRLFRAWSRLWDLSKPILAEKSPHNIIKTRFLQKLFSKSKFIIIIRNGIVQSTGEALQQKRSPVDCCNEWVSAYRFLLKDLPYLKHYLIIRYEDLTNNTNAVLKRIWNFIEVPHVDISNSEFYVKAFQNGIKRSSLNKVNDMNRPHIQNFLTIFDDKLQKIMLQICEPMMDAFGYLTDIKQYHDYIKQNNYQLLLKNGDYQ